MGLTLGIPKVEFDLKPRITIIGVGGAGNNAVNNMIRSNLEGVEYMICNTDAQALSLALCENCVQLGPNLTRGLGAGSRPDVGRAAAEEVAEEINEHIRGTNMLFITAGMGGGTGTGAAPVIARLAREQGILTVGVVTKPFHFEGVHRMRIAETGVQELSQNVDTLIIIPNQNLFRVANETTTFSEAFLKADKVLTDGVDGIVTLMVRPGLINLDFNDIRTVMSEMGNAMMGTGEGAGDRRAIEAAEAAISNPLLEDISIEGAHAVLINITGGHDMTLFHVDEAATYIREKVDSNANIIVGSTFDPNMEGRMRISVVATGIRTEEQKEARNQLVQSRYNEASKQSSAPSKANAQVINAAAPQNHFSPSNSQDRTALTEQERHMFMTNDSQQTASSQGNISASSSQMTPSGLRVNDPKIHMSQASSGGGYQKPHTSMGANPTQNNYEEAFIPPQPVEPQGNSYIQNERVRVSQPAQQSSEPYDGGDRQKKLSFFERVTGVRLSKPKAPEQAPQQQQPMQQQQVQNVSMKPNSVSSTQNTDELGMNRPKDEERLDIPAFLRRQVN
jgi:cell division protein FtsZ